MKSVLPLIALVLFASSCSTAYKSGQTPDDVYYSPAPKNMGDEYVQMNREDNRRYRRQQQEEVFNEYSYDDRYLRMKVRNRRRWSDIDLYYTDPFAYRSFDRFYGNNYWSPYGYWNAYSTWDYLYNPYYRPFGQVIVVNPNNPVYNRPRTTNLNTYFRTNTGTDAKRGYYNNSNNNSYTSPSNNNSYSQPRSFGNELRNSFGSSNSNNNSSNSAPSRSSSPSSSSSSSSSGSSGSSAPIRKF